MIVDVEVTKTGSIEFMKTDCSYMRVWILDKHGKWVRPKAMFSITGISVEEIVQVA